MPAWQDNFDKRLLEIMQERPPEDGALRILEAGGGSRSYIRLPHQMHVTTIDISPEQIAQNTTSDMAIVGDLATHDFGESRFDIVVCWNVLEHVPEVTNAIQHLVETVDEGGLFVVRGPDPRSMKGVITDLTPHWVHVRFHRHVLGRPNAGKPGFAPFPTELEADAGPELLRNAFAAAGLEVIYEDRFVGDHVVSLKQRYPVIHALYSAAGWFTRVFTAGRYGSTLSDFVIVGRRRSQAHETGLRLAG
ncbi:MAG: class I SAM-dependent methyltransferase [Paracoccaceae bacterium]|nr:class I SAM-dependent methyltransferase [Paracoccaceae bacterium]